MSIYKQAKCLGLNLWLMIFVVMLLLSACSVLPPVKPKVITYYRLDPQWAAPSAAVVPAGERVILVGTPNANAALNSPRMSYVQRNQTLSYYARSHWVDTPPRMLQSLLTRALESQGSFSAVIQTSGAARAGFRLDTELLEFQQIFITTPSEFHIKMRVQLVDVRQRMVVATQIFEAREPATENNPHGGTVAASRALAKLLPELAEFCARNTIAGEAGSES